MNGLRSQTAKVRISHVMVGDSVVRPADSVKTLGAAFTSRMIMEAYVTALCRSARFHLRNIGKIRRYLTAEACERLLHVLLSCHPDLHNALLVGLPQCLVAKTDIQRCQNVAAHTATCHTVVMRVCTGRLTFIGARCCCLEFYGVFKLKFRVVG